jgi:hypothetical protein
MPHTVVDLWRMVQDNHCNTIIMLNEWQEEDEVRTTTVTPSSCSMNGRRKMR